MGSSMPVGRPGSKFRIGAVVATEASGRYLPPPSMHRTPIGERPPEIYS